MKTECETKTIQESHIVRLYDDSPGTSDPDLQSGDVVVSSSESNYGGVAVRGCYLVGDTVTGSSLRRLHRIGMLVVE